MSKKKRASNEIFDSGLTIVKPVVLLPERCNSLLKAIQKKVNNNEFSILFRGEWTRKGWLISSDFFIPKQEVSTSSVDYKENLHDLLESGFNTVYHSHPFQSTSFSFSQSDIESINLFPVSILGGRDGAKLANISVSVDSGILQIPATIEIVPDDIEIDLSNINEKKTIIEPYINHRRMWDHDDWWRDWK